MHHTFQNKKAEKVFKKVRDHKLDIKLDHPKGTIKHIMQAQEIVEPYGPVEPHFEKCGTLPLMSLKYSIGSVKTHFNDAVYHMLPKTLKFSTTKMQCVQDNQEDFIWVVMWVRRVKGKESTNVFGTMWSYLAI